MLKNKNYVSYLKHIKQEKQGRKYAVLLNCGDISKQRKDIEAIEHNKKILFLVSSLEILKNKGGLNE